MNPSFNINKEKDFTSQLETIIDSKGMNYIFMALQDICEGKSQHCAENWQDEQLAATWRKIADKIESFRLKHESAFPL